VNRRRFSYKSSPMPMFPPSFLPSLPQVLQAWHPSDSSAHLILFPWAPPVFDPRSLESLLLQSILPKLVAALRALPIVPQNQV